ncbi:putative secreted protein [Wickerhamomyces ciferrii]|uniref:Secreted protein n=1 Tax=Wickerhamomyces ciferrii (strain ATCC 14091 / BCRC 22168 / CBS 111 / JCM 3599 / NBRC 0793 / NRRL Y-1031 F-60-10) TaxID=1206466 RepID=K0KX14_WICCF|nr:uncharacterized protein BN7_6185 [Wickerhamomyces ciferrii]CCH46592.1 putative secreted protein [Wickerhamomyces ciferrii]
MQSRYSLLTAASLVGSSLAAYIPSEPWSTLTPEAPAPSGATTEYTKTFGIAVVPIATTSAAPKAKRDVISQIGDGQIQATTSAAASNSAKPTAQVISQIGDGQIQATTSTASAPKQTAQVVSQIGDGQIQATTSTASAPKQTAQVVSQIGDGQIQATTSTSAPKESAQVISQIGDGQIQATTATTSTDVVSQIGDGQIQATSTSGAAEPSSTGAHKSGDLEIQSTSCLTDESLALTLKDSILTDAKGRLGAIVANRQFQFDGPPPQAGSIYAAGWSITKDGNLAIGDNDVFYQCLSGSFYNLYDENVAEQCTAIHLEIVDLVSC